MVEDSEFPKPAKRNGAAKFFQLTPLNTGHILILVTMLAGVGSLAYGLRAQIDQNSQGLKQAAERDDAFREQIKFIMAEMRRLELEERLEREKVVVRFEQRSEQASAGQAVIIQRIAVLESQLQEARAEIRRLIDQFERRTPSRSRPIFIILREAKGALCRSGPCCLSFSSSPCSADSPASAAVPGTAAAPTSGGESDSCW